jgi:hypothetical protein
MAALCGRHVGLNVSVPSSEVAFRSLSRCFFILQRKLEDKQANRLQVQARSGNWRRIFVLQVMSCSAMPSIWSGSPLTVPTATAGGRASARLKLLLFKALFVVL